MRRREFLIALVSAPLTVASYAQEGRVPRLGILSPTGRTGGHSGIVHLPFKEALAGLGWEDGRNIEIIERFAEDRYERLPALAAEIVASRSNVIFTNTVNGARAAAAATGTIPIVVAPAAENVFAELAVNFARPVRNVTGFTLHSQGQDEKCLEMLKEAVPSAARVGILVNPLNPIWDAYPASLRQVGHALGLDLVRIEARGVDDVEGAFRTVGSVHGVHVPDDATLAGRPASRAKIVEIASAMKAPVVSTHLPFASDGCLAALGADIPALARRGAEYIDRILKGARPADLPVERPTVVKMIVNLNTARALNLSIPPSLLLRADEVIE
jgi:putative tryptophan/tyrosine transport system substrate-binding protein